MTTNNTYAIRIAITFAEWFRDSFPDNSDDWQVTNTAILKAWEQLSLIEGNLNANG